MDNKKFQSYYAVISEPLSRTNFPNLTAEILVETALADAWNNINHELNYSKSDSSTTKINIAINQTEHLEKSLNDFISLLEKPNVHKKKDIHPYLDKHRFILSSSSSLILSEQQIGIGKQFQIDFLIRKPIGSYILVEIENPNHKLFIKSGAMTSATSHAVGQVEEWQEWIEDNLTSVQKKYPDISSPEGVVIIGRSSELSDEERKKLNRKNINSRGSLTILTYDDLIADARAYIKSINDNLKYQ